MLSQEKIAERYPDTFIIRDGCLYRNTIGNGNGKITKRCKALVKQLAEEGLIKTLPSGNTVSLRFAGKNRRYIALKKNLIEFILNGE